MAESPTITPGYLAVDYSTPLLNACIALIVLETFFTSLYFVSRFIQKHGGWVDPLITLVGYLCNLGMVVLNFVLISKKIAGRHVESVVLEDPNKIVLFSKVEIAAQVLYNPATTLPKLVICHLYLNILRNKWARRITYLTGLVIILTGVSLELCTFLQCRPFAFYWNKTIPGGQCGNLMLQFKVAAIPNLVTDLAILLLPMPMVWRLHTSRAQKIGLTLTFLTGSVGIITCIVRFYYFFTVDFFADPTYEVITIGTWVIVEPGMYLIASTLPFLRHLGPKVLQSSAFQSSRRYLTTLIRRSSSASSQSSDTKTNGGSDIAMEDRQSNSLKLQPRTESMYLRETSDRFDSSSA